MPPEDNDRCCGINRYAKNMEPARKPDTTQNFESMTLTIEGSLGWASLPERTKRAYAEGWRLVASTNQYLFLERPLQPQEKTGVFPFLG